MTHIQGSPQTYGCPFELIDQIGGWSSIGTIGSKYGQGYELDVVRDQLDAVKLS